MAMARNGSDGSPTASSHRPSHPVRSVLSTDAFHQVSERLEVRAALPREADALDHAESAVRTSRGPAPRGRVQAVAGEAGERHHLTLGNGQVRAAVVVAAVAGRHERVEAVVAPAELHHHEHPLGMGRRAVRRRGRRGRGQPGRVVHAVVDERPPRGGASDGGRGRRPSGEAEERATAQHASADAPIIRSPGRESTARRPARPRPGRRWRAGRRARRWWPG